MSSYFYGKVVVAMTGSGSVMVGETVTRSRLRGEKRRGDELRGRRGRRSHRPVADLGRQILWATRSTTLPAEGEPIMSDVPSNSGPGRRPRVDAASAEGSILTSASPQSFHHAKLAEGIEPLAPGTVTVRRMADIQALTRSHAVRQFGASNARQPSERGRRPRSRPRRAPRRDPARAQWRRAHEVAQDPRPSLRATRSWPCWSRASASARTSSSTGSSTAARSMPTLNGAIRCPRRSFCRSWGSRRRSGSISSRSRTSSSRRDPFAARRPGARWRPSPTARSGSPPSSIGVSARATYGDDIIGWLLHAEVDGRRITRDELHGICNLLMIAGLDTVAASLSCILAHLARQPRPAHQIVGDPACGPTAIEELMRFESPVTQGFRHVVEDVELPSGTHGGRHQRRSSGGRRPTSIPRPSTIRSTVRLDREPNAHICFASGWHRCLGSHLARMELRAALDVWHQPDPRLPDRAPASSSSTRSIPALPTTSRSTGRSAI